MHNRIFIPLNSRFGISFSNTIHYDRTSFIDVSGVVGQYSEFRAHCNNQNYNFKTLEAEFRDFKNPNLMLTNNVNFYGGIYHTLGVHGGARIAALIVCLYSVEVQCAINVDHVLWEAVFVVALLQSTRFY